MVGAGYTGLSSALHLAERGYKVIVIEAETVGFGASGRNGGHVGTGQRQDQQYLEDQIWPRGCKYPMGYEPRGSRYG